MGALSSTSPIQNSAESPTGQNELNDNKITVEQVPKPRKFFKSRNAAPTAEIQQQMVMQQQQATYQQQQSYQNHQAHQQEHNQYHQSGGDDEEQVQKRGRKKKPAVKKEKVEKLPKPEKVPKPKKEKKVRMKEIPAPTSEPAESEGESPSPTRRGRAHIEPTRSSGRARAKCVNYNEDAGEDEFYTRIERRIVPRSLVTATVTSSPQDPPVVEEATPLAVLEVPVPQQSPSLHPPIVLRISKVRLNICFVIT